MHRSVLVCFVLVLTCLALGACNSDQPRHHKTVISTWVEGEKAKAPRMEESSSETTEESQKQTPGQ